MEKEYIISHHGIKGQRWGVRRYQNEDGSLTAAGKKMKARQDNKNRLRVMQNKINPKGKTFTDPYTGGQRTRPLLNREKRQLARRTEKIVKRAQRFVEKKGMTNAQALYEGEKSLIKSEALTKYLAGLAVVTASTIYSANEVRKGL